MILVDTEEKFIELIENLDDNILVYGDGTVARQFVLQIREYYGTLDKVKMFCVSKMNQPMRMFDKPVVEYDERNIQTDQTIVVALGRKARAEVEEAISESKGNVFIVDSAIMKSYGKEDLYYEDCIGNLKTFLEQSVYSVEELIETKTVQNNKKLYAWTCWWQGEMQAPDLVRACINSQRKNMPKEVEHVVITEKNYTDYIQFPDYIMRKVQDGSITLTTFSDMLREKLLYEYGGIWFDATVLIHKLFPYDYFMLPLYTCKGKEHHFGSYSKWSLWCMGGVSGNVFFKLLYELFFEYYKCNDKIKYYLTVDYFIKAALIYVDGAAILYDRIPINNENADNLAKHLKEEYSQKLYNKLTQNTYLSKLTTKHFDGRNGKDFKGFSDTSIYEYILGQYLDKR